MPLLTRAFPPPSLLSPSSPDLSFPVLLFLSAAFCDATTAGRTTEAVRVRFIDMILGIGIDVVDCEAFAEQLHQPGSVFTSQVFTAREWRTVARRLAEKHGLSFQPGAPLPLPAVPHLAARWAAKEAVVKAWSAALYGTVPPLGEGEVDWREIEVVHDQWHRPAIRLHGQFAQRVAESLGDLGISGDALQWHLSLSHDGSSAIAYVLLEAPGQTGENSGGCATL